MSLRIVVPKSRQLFAKLSDDGSKWAVGWTLRQGRRGPWAQTLNTTLFGNLSMTRSHMQEVEISHKYY